MGLIAHGGPATVLLLLLLAAVGLPSSTGDVDAHAPPAWERAASAWRDELDLGEASRIATARLVELHHVQTNHSWEASVLELERGRLLAVVAFGLMERGDLVRGCQMMVTAINLAQPPDATVWSYAMVLERRLALATGHEPPHYDFLERNGWPTDQTIGSPSWEGEPAWRAPRPTTPPSSDGRRGLYDAMVPCHSKDAAMLPLVLRWLRRHAVGLGTIWVVADLESVVPPGAVWVPESAFAFRKAGFPRTDVYQQLLKLLFLETVPGARDRLLVCDADVLWLRDVEFVGADGALLYGYESHTPWDVWERADGGYGYPDFVRRLLGLSKPRADKTAIVHHMMLERSRVRALLRHVHARFLTGASGSAEFFPGSPGAPLGGGVGPDPWPSWAVLIELVVAFSLPRPSEYELYHTFTTHLDRNGGGSSGGGGGHRQAVVGGSRVRDRHLPFADFGACLHAPSGVAVGSESDIERMHGGLAEHFAYIACHRHMRDRHYDEGGTT